MSKDRRLQEDRRHKEACLGRIFHSVPTAMGMIADHILHHVNRRMCELTGYCEAELLGKESRMLYPDHEAYLIADRHMHCQSGVLPGTTLETRWRHRDGSNIDVLLASNRLPRQDSTMGYAFSALDITEYKRSENEFRRHQWQLEKTLEQQTAELRIANRELQDFALSVSHDLKAPLRSIIGFSEIISRRHLSSLNAEGQRYFGHILTAGSNMNRLIDDLLEFSRLGSGGVNIRPVPLADIFSDIQNTFQQRVAQLDGCLHLPQETPTVLGDSALLKLIFTQLIDNALCYRRNELPPLIEIRCHTEAGKAHLSVDDNGTGIPQELQDKVFDIFQRLHNDPENPGSGIGLAMVKKAILMTAGQIRLESLEDKGSTFFIELPLYCP